MRLLVAFALFVTAAYAHHTPDHKLKYPEFIEKKTHLYDMTINMTTGVHGLHTQVSKAVIHMEVKIYAKTKTHLIVWAERVLVSQSLPGVNSDVDKITLKKNAALEDKMKKPITAEYVNGKITSYTLDSNESVESAKIKRTILRNLEVYLDQTVLTGNMQPWSPLTYNHTRITHHGNYSSHYVVNSSPNPVFPNEKNVFNITRFDNFETIPYLAYESHHNFHQQGCPEVCNKNHIENPYGAGCPSQLEPFNTPLKRGFYQQHNLRKVKTGETVHDIIITTETHTADLYDQNMDVTIKSVIRFKGSSSKSIHEPTGQKSHRDLNDWEIEINEKEISDLCGYPDPREAVNSAKKILEEISKTVIEGAIESPKSKLIGEQVILLQKALTVLKEGDLRNIQQTIVNFDDLPSASELDKVKRQIWIDVIPLIGTDESISFIVQLIQENVNKPNKAISLWESKAILEALPMNILEPTERTITKLVSLIDVVTETSTPGYKLFDSASHLAVSRVIQILCSVSNGVPDEEESSSRNGERLRLRSGHYHRVCPKTIVKQFVTDIAEKLKTTTDNAKRVIYIQTLARTGLVEVLKYLKPYANGHIRGLSRSYIDYIRTVTIHTFYHIATAHPKEVQDIVVAIFFNKTEPPKVRTASFGVIVKTRPSLGLFQYIAEETWREPSNEVASYVTSTLETVGNSTIPCHQLIARRIKKVLPQIKRSVGGKHHAQNVLWTLFDSVRGFGLENHLEFTPSNESFIPSVIYAALGANVDSFRDVFFQFAVTSQGLTSRNVWDSFLKALKISPAEDIPKSKESEIFPDIEVLPRDPEFWRAVFFEKLFYTSSYYYYDGQESNSHEFYKILKDQLSHYITVNKHGDLDGHIVKVYIPSSYHTKSISHALPNPVEFEMRNPLVLSVKLKTEVTKSSSGSGVSLHIVPSVYYTTLYTNQILNLGDCKHVGVYHQKRVAVTYPVKISVTVEKEGHVGFSYTFPELPKTVFTYHSEAGTYAGSKKLVALPPMEDRRTYKTIPSQFERKDTFGAVGFPPFTSHILTEDIQFGYEKIPRDSHEALNQMVKEFLNAGWRRKSVVIKRIPSPPLWIPSTEIKVSLDFGRRHVIPKSISSEDWTKSLKFDDNLTEKDTDAYATEGQHLTSALVSMPHIKDRVSLKVEQSLRGKSAVTGYLDIIYRHTYGGMVHLVHVNASTKIPQLHKNVSASASYAIAFTGRPDEFNYNAETYGRQKGVAYGTISFNKLAPFTKPTIAGKAVFHYIPLEEYLKRELSPLPTREHFRPDTHSECLKDVSIGKSQSVACTKAVREWSIFNNIHAHALWNTTLPSFVEKAAHHLDLALKHAYYTHLTTHKSQAPSKFVRFDATYIDKMTDEPVVDVVINKPYETLYFRRVSSEGIRPVSSIDSVYDTYVQQYTNNTYPATCALMEKYIRTYDLGTFKLPREDIPSCTYVLSTHCTEHKKFAVLVTIDPEVPGTKEIHIYLGKDEYTLTPGKGSSEYDIKHNGRVSVIKPHHPLMFDEKAITYASVHVTTGSASPVVFTAEKAGIKITYNGKSLRIQVHPRYKGELCGLCSEFNGEINREWKGIDQCLYSHSSDFFKSSSVGTCGDRGSVYDKICSEDEVTFSQLRPAQAGRDPTLKRNVVLQREDKFCFSTKPMPACESGIATTSETQNIDFHCLPKADHNARKLVVESRKRALQELENKRVHFTEPVDIPTKC